mgnify:FL=1
MSTTSLSTKPFFWVFIVESLILLIIMLFFHQRQGMTVGIAAAAIYIVVSFIKQCWMTGLINRRNEEVNEV